MTSDSRPVWLEFFAGEGGTAAGIDRAGFRVICVDINPKCGKRNPFTFEVADAVSPLAFWSLVEQYKPAVIGGGPPCQDFSPLKARTGKTYPRLIAPFRELLLMWGGPYVIENVERARPHMVKPRLYCGSMFIPAPTVDGLLLKRHRLFESNVDLTTPSWDACAHGVKHAWWRGFINVHGGGASRETRGPNGERIGHGNKASAAEARALMGIDWMSVAGMNEAIPPRYSEHVARQVLTHIEGRRAA